MYLILKNINPVIYLYILICLFSCADKKQNTKNQYVDVMKSEVLIDKAIAQSWNLLTEGQKMADTGKSKDDIIKTFPEGTLFSANSNSIVLFIEGSIPMIIELDKKSKQKKQYKGISGNSVLTPRIKSPQNLAIRPFTTPAPNDVNLVGVVGSNKGDDERQIKKALILAPYNKTDFK